MSTKKNLLFGLLERQIKRGSGPQFQRDNYVRPEFIDRMGLKHVLQGHSGCVNCIQWNDAGTILASGSDDYQIIVWNPFTCTQLRKVDSGHKNNIFDVQFVPNSCDSLILSGAGDAKVILHDLNRAAGETRIQVYSCHRSRVKRIAVTPAQPHLFWSAAEDGLVMQYDVRCPLPTACSRDCTHCIISARGSVGREAECKCISVNPCRPHLIAVGCNDPYVRVYDRRMLKPCTIALSTQSEPVTSVNLWDQSSFGVDLEVSDDWACPQEAVQYYCPGHLPGASSQKRRLRPLASTYVTWSACGKDLLVNLGGEQIYLFDSTNKKTALLANLKKFMDFMKVETAFCDKSTTNGYSSPCTSYSNPYSNGVTLIKADFLTKSEKDCGLPEKAARYKERAKVCFEEENYSKAIQLYTSAICEANNSAVLRSNRAACFIKRAWDGDYYCALRDCFKCLQLDGAHVKALFRMAKCLMLLHHFHDAIKCLEIFKKKFPSYAKSANCVALEKDIRQEMFDKKDGNNKEKIKRRRSRSSDADHQRPLTIDVNTEPSPPNELDFEMELRKKAIDFDTRFCGHCNTTTDIKEANFFGRNGEYILAGSDDGSFFIWQRKSASIVKVLRGDESIVNCLQPHPTACLLATSGIQSVIKIWEPMQEGGQDNPYEIEDVNATAQSNQNRMNADPLELMLYNMGYTVGQGVPSDNEELADRSDNNPTTIQCRQS